MRNKSLDFFRGIAALNIIFIHTVFWSGEQYVPQVVRTLALLIDVPFFFFLSGWSFNYCKSIGRNIFHLFLLWFKWVVYISILGIICYILKMQGLSSALDYFNNVFFIVSFPEFPVFSGSMWFMPVYISVLLSIGTFILLLNKNLDEKNTVGSFLCVMIVLYFYTQFGGNAFNLSGQFLFYSVFFLLGYVLQNRTISTTKFIIFEILIIALSIIWGGFLNINLLNLQGAKFPPTIVYGLASLIFIIFVVFARPFLKDNKFNIIQHIGKNALYYYFAQGIGGSLIYYWVNWAITNQVKLIVVLIIALLINITITVVIAELYRFIYEMFYTWIHNFYMHIRLKNNG